MCLPPATSIAPDEVTVSGWQNPARGERGVRRERRVAVAGAAGGLAGADLRPDGQGVRAVGVERRAVAVGGAGGRRAVPGDAPGERAPREVHRAVRVQVLRRQRVAGLAADRGPDRAVAQVRLVGADRDGVGAGRARRGDGRCGVRRRAVARGAAQRPDVELAVDVLAARDVDGSARGHGVGVAARARRVRRGGERAAGCRGRCRRRSGRCRPPSRRAACSCRRRRASRRGSRWSRWPPCGPR